MESNFPYVFNIVNCEKQNSQFNYGISCFFCYAYLVFPSYKVTVTQMLKYGSYTLTSVTPLCYGLMKIRNLKQNKKFVFSPVIIIP